MASDNVNVRITGELRKHLLQQTGDHGLYENSSEYIRDLIRKDITSRKEAWNWLRNELEPALYADESEYQQVSAADVIARNKKKVA
ncbi:MAG: transcriptional regulator [Gammaproteobacteria bacterium]|nr:transcriptional regulator [Gammaproteobacteria bacterium]